MSGVGGERDRPGRPGLGAAVRFARRELRTGTRGFRIFLLSLILGVGAVAAVGSLGAAVSQGIRDQGRMILGGDASLRLTHRPATPAQLAHLEDAGRVSRITTLRAMARREGPVASAAEIDREPGSDMGPDAASGPGRRLVELKAVDSAYPLFGEVEIVPPQDLAAALAPRPSAAGPIPGALADASLMATLDLSVGSRLRLGEAVFEVRGEIAFEPDKGVSPGIFGPRLLISEPGLEATGLIRPGSMVRYFYRVDLPDGIDPAIWADDLKTRFPDAWWRIQTSGNALPGVQFFIDRMAQFLTLVGLAALLVGGVGIANGVRAFLASRTESIATLKCLGAPAALIFRTYLLEIGVMAALGIAGGLAVGALAPPVAGLFADVLPVPVAGGIYPAPLALAALFGLLTALAFSLLPLGEAEKVSPALLFRGLVDPAPRRAPRRYQFIVAGLLLALGLLAIWASVDRVVALWFVLGAGATFAMFRLAAAGVIRLARRMQIRHRPGLRLAIANLHRPGAPTPGVVLSLGLGITVLVAVALIESNLAREIDQRMPKDAPAFFFIDIQPDQLEGFTEIVSATPGTGEVAHVPNLRGRLVAVDGVPLDQVSIAPEVAWITRGDRGITTAARPPAEVDIVDGEWWAADYAGAPLISFDVEAARGMALGVGDTLTVNILGREITGTIANLRQIDWRSLSLNYVMIFSPGVLAGAPVTHVATVVAPPEVEDRLERRVTDAFPNISAIRVRDALEAANAIVADVALAVRLTALVAVFAGALVLAGAIAAGHQRRIYDAVILKVVGAPRRFILGSFLMEFAFLGLITTLIAALGGTLAAYAVITELMETPWSFDALALLVTAASAVLLTALGGFAGTWRALGARAGPLLRNP
ncbi:MAG: FtsX-like permease family protein [Alphaproteobacteria bacterium]